LITLEANDLKQANEALKNDLELLRSNFKGVVEKSKAAKDEADIEIKENSEKLEQAYNVIRDQEEQLAKASAEGESIYFC